MREMVWNGRDQLRRVLLIDRPSDPDDDEVYDYGADGARVRKTTRRLVSGNVEATETVYLDGCELRRITQSTTVILERWSAHAEVGDDRLATIYFWETDTLERETDDVDVVREHYHLGTSLGSVSLEVDGAGALLAYEEYFPYGRTAFLAGDAVIEIQFRTRRFAGKDQDDATGFYAFQFRYYAPFIGNWVSPDPAGEVDGPNRYWHARNNPVTLTDPNGLTVLDEPEVFARDQGDLDQWRQTAIERGVSAGDIASYEQQALDAKARGETVYLGFSQGGVPWIAHGEGPDFEQRAQSQAREFGGEVDRFGGASAESVPEGRTERTLTVTPEAPATSADSLQDTPAPLPPPSPSAEAGAQRPAEPDATGVGAESEPSAPAGNGLPDWWYQEQPPALTPREILYGDRDRPERGPRTEMVRVGVVRSGGRIEERDITIPAGDRWARRLVEDSISAANRDRAGYEATGRSLAAGATGGLSDSVPAAVDIVEQYYDRGRQQLEQRDYRGFSETVLDYERRYLNPVGQALGGLQAAREGVPAALNALQDWGLSVVHSARPGDAGLDARRLTEGRADTPEARARQDAERGRIESLPQQVLATVGGGAAVPFRLGTSRLGHGGALRSWRARRPAPRHRARSVRERTLARDRNTVMDPSVDISADIDAIASGRCTFGRTVDGEPTVTVNGRTYVVEPSGVLSPRSGPGMTTLSRRAFRALGILNEHGNSARAAFIMNRRGIPLGERLEALRVWMRTR